MKRLLAVMIVLLLIFPIAVSADEAPPWFFVKVTDIAYSLAGAVDPILAAYGILHSSMQFGLSESCALTGHMTTSDFYNDISVMSVGVGARFYPAKIVRNGFYMGSFLSYTQVSEDYPLADYSAFPRKVFPRKLGAGYIETSRFFGYGIELGAMIEVRELFFIDLGIGLMRYAIQELWTGFPAVVPVCNALFGAKF
ncbi:MAG: hypothetical protein LBC99_10500 [Spirochaetota bacterium]|jgi:hypothetical protein|nr:hypothetical protein [Spirochaetota bacterium]